LREKQDEIASLEARIEKAKGHVDHYKEVAAAAEESLKQVSYSNRSRSGLVLLCWVAACVLNVNAMSQELVSKADWSSFSVKSFIL